MGKGTVPSGPGSLTLAQREDDLSKGKRKERPGMTWRWRHELWVIGIGRDSVTEASPSPSPSSLSPLASSRIRRIFHSWLFGKSFSFPTGLIARLSDYLMYLMFLFCSAAGLIFVCMVCYTKPALSRLSNALKVNALAFISWCNMYCKARDYWLLVNKCELRDWLTQMRPARLARRCAACEGRQVDWWLAGKNGGK